MKNSFWGLIWSSFWEIQGFLIGFLSLSVTIVLAIFVGNTPIPLYWFFIVISVALLIIATLLKALNTTKNILPKILVTRTDEETGCIECLLEPSKILGYDMYVSFYYTDSYGFEALIGVGYIKDIQSNGKIKALIDQPVSAYEDILKQLANNNNQVIKQTIVRPGQPTKL
ncbi:MAG: hypothetical protein AB4060_13785 [Crocosphaera sp.]